MPDGFDDLTPLAAAQIVGDADCLEQGLTARTFGLTLMLWAQVAFGAFFVSYTLAAGGSEIGPSIGMMAIMMMILAAVLTTNRLWKSQALSDNVGFRPWAIWSQGIALLVVGFALMIVIDARLTETDSAVSLAFVATIIIGYLGIRLGWQRGRNWILWSASGLVLADVALLIFAPQRLPDPSGAAHLMSALAVSLALFVPGFAYYSRG
jgi:heme A synthase